MEQAELDTTISGGKLDLQNWIPDKAEQKSTFRRELCGIVSALQNYDHHIIVSPFPTYSKCVHKWSPYLCGRKAKLSIDSSGTKSISRSARTQKSSGNPDRITLSLTSRPATWQKHNTDNNNRNTRQYFEKINSTTNAIPRSQSNEQGDNLSDSNKRASPDPLTTRQRREDSWISERFLPETALTTNFKYCQFNLRTRGLFPNWKDIKNINLSFKLLPQLKQIDYTEDKQETTSPDEADQATRNDDNYLFKIALSADNYRLCKAKRPMNLWEKPRLSQRHGNTVRGS